MILHIIPDEKFAPFLHGVFEEVSPGNNQFRVVHNISPARHLVNGVGVEPVTSAYFLSRRFAREAANARCVVFHFLTFEMLLAASRLPGSVPVLWRGWGADYYPLLEKQGMQTVLPGTGALVPSRSILARAFGRRSLREVVLGILSRIRGGGNRERFAARPDFFSCCVPDDFEALRSAVPGWRAQFVPLNYYSVEDTFLKGAEGPQEGPDILLGNSATPTNNHLEAFNSLAALGLDHSRVVVPLGYGDHRYREAVIDAGQELLPDSFNPVTQFLPLEEYNQMISSCGNVIMNHVRQQAIGTVSAALLRGARVFLRPESPIYRYFTREGAVLFPFPGGLTRELLNEPLEEADRHTNHQVMKKLWSRSRCLDQVKTFMERLAAKEA